MDISRLLQSSAPPANPLLSDSSPDIAPPPRMSITSILNDAPPPVPAPVDASSVLLQLSAHARTHGSVLVPPALLATLQGLINNLPPASPTPPVTPPRTSSSTSLPSPSVIAPSKSDTFPEMEVSHNVKTTRQTTLSVLYTYHDPHAYVEYPETSPGNPVGYLFRRDPQDWLSPLSDTAYSWGRPGGQAQRRHGQAVTHELLVDAKNQKIPCVEIHGTCQGCKACPYAAPELYNTCHTSATRDDVLLRITQSREFNSINASPNILVFKNTVAYLAGLRKAGCHASEHEETVLSSDEEEEFDAIQSNNRTIRKGYKDPTRRCQGRIQYAEDWEGKPLVHCEHYHSRTSRAHYVEYLDQAMYDISYIEARLTGDLDEAENIEDEYAQLGCGPLANCCTVVNFNSRRPNCPFDHRLENGLVMQPLMQHIPCQVKFRMFQPLEAYRNNCPFVFVQFDGIHDHTVPLPTTTPQHIRSELFGMFAEMEEDMADMTARRFIRHPITRAYVSSKFPGNPSATLADVHTSLANRDHLTMYISQARTQLYPEGTGWAGIQAEFQRQHQAEYPVEARYIRRIIDLDPDDLPSHPEDDQPDSSDGSNRLKIIICMDQEGSRRLQAAQYLQSDISFKRVVGYREFTIGSWDRNNQTSHVFCRVFMNRETAEAHKRVFDEISAIVLEDVGEPLRWRHLDSENLEDHVGILHWGGDQGGGQAKGLGLHLQSVAQQRPRRDLHEPTRLTSELSPYEHLRRLYRLCGVHFKRNIRKCAVPDDIRIIMRGLNCLRHADWNGALTQIRQSGKAGRDWLSNKEASHFVFPAICWERSFIPLDIWKAGDRNDNLIETTHADVNREGKMCSLVSGVEKGRRYDMVKLKSLWAIEQTGIRPSYRSGHYSANATRNIKRLYLSRGNTLRSEDQKIESYNAKFNEHYDKYLKARRNRDAKRQERSELLARPHGATAVQYEKAEKAVVRTEKAAEKAFTDWVSYVQKTLPTLPLGTGRLQARDLTEFNM